MGDFADDDVFTRHHILEDLEHAWAGEDAIVSAEEAIVSAEDADNGQVKIKKRGGRRHKSQWMKKPMALSEVILELQDEDLRENALRCLSGHLIERREQDVDYYRNAAFLLYNSCSTLAILLQEIVSSYTRLAVGDLNVRGSKRLANVLTLFQQACQIFLLPFILSAYTEEVYENIRIISLSIIDLTCKASEEEVIQWALNNDLIAACVYAIEVGSRLSKVISMSILESILRDKSALAAISDPTSTLLMDILKMLVDLVAVLAVAQDFSPRLIFHVIRTYVLLCQHPRALELVKEHLPQQLLDHTFHDFKKVYPLFRNLQHQLLLNTGKAKTCLPHVSPDSEIQSPAISPPLDFCAEIMINPFPKSSPTEAPKTTPQTPSDMATPLRPLDLNKHEWSSSARLASAMEFSLLLSSKQTNDTAGISGLENISL